MSDKMGFNHSFLDWGFCFHNTYTVSRNESFFKEMSLEMDLWLTKKKKGVAPLLSYKHMLVQVKYIV